MTSTDVLCGKLLSQLFIPDPIHFCMVNNTHLKKRSILLVCCFPPTFAEYMIWTVPHGYSAIYGQSKKSISV